MELRSKKPIGHFHHFHHREKTDSDPQAGLTANVRQHVHESDRSCLIEVFHEQGLALYIEFHVVLLDLLGPRTRPVRRQRHVGRLDECFDLVDHPIRRGGQRRDFRDEANRFTFRQTIRTVVLRGI